MNNLPAAITELLEANGLAHHDQPERPGMIAYFFGRYYDQTRDLRYLEYTISHLREGVDVIHTQSPRYPVYLNDLGA